MVFLVWFMVFLMGESAFGSVKIISKITIEDYHVSSKVLSDLMQCEKETNAEPCLIVKIETDVVCWFCETEVETHSFDYSWLKKHDFQVEMALENSKPGSYIMNAIINRCGCHLLKNTDYYSSYPRQIVIRDENEVIFRDINIDGVLGKNIVTKPTCNTRVDIAFLIDGTGNFLSDNLDKIKIFVKELATSFGVGQRHHSKGHLSILNKDSLHTVIEFDSCKNPYCFGEKVDAMAWREITTSFDSFIQLIGAFLLESKKIFINERPGIHNILIFMTDSLEASHPDFIGILRREPEATHTFIVNSVMDKDNYKKLSKSVPDMKKTFTDNYIHLGNDDFKNVTLIDTIVKHACEKVEGEVTFRREKEGVCPQKPVSNTLKSCLDEKKKSNCERDDQCPGTQRCCEESYTCMTKYLLVSTSKECSGAETSKGKVESVDACAAACLGVSSMFLLSDGKYCYCEVASTDGVCHDEIDINGYSLYKLIPINDGSTESLESSVVAKSPKLRRKVCTVGIPTADLKQKEARADVDIREQ